MNDVAVPEAWLEANQRYLCAEFARIGALIESPRSAVRIENAEREIAQSRATLPRPAAIDELASAFTLSAFERDVLLLAAGVEMDTRLARACAEGGARFEFALTAFAGSHWSALSPAWPLRRWRLLELGDGGMLVKRALRIDERVLHYLAGLNTLDARLQPLLRPRAVPRIVAAHQAELAGRIGRGWKRAPRRWPPLLLHGNDSEGQEDVAAIAAADAGLTLHVLRAEDLPQASLDRYEFATLWTREAALLNSALLIHADAGAYRALLAPIVEAIDAPVIVAAREPLDLQLACRRFGVAKPDAGEQRRLWRQALGADASTVDLELELVASQFGLSAQAIARAAEDFRSRIEAGDDAAACLLPACRSAATVALDGLAQRVEPAATWSDLVLPAHSLAALREIAAHLRYRRTVYEAWGFAAKCSRGLGITALFGGESGTGKTMAAEVLAGDLGLELYQIDLSMVISKYIGETEKNLCRVFDAAEQSGAILLFDEADALFGKRSEVKDSHDRYANIEVSYLLQRMEAYRGLAILTTNALPSALDRAIHRRLRFIVQFSFPDADQRERIWRGVFPPATPLHDLDYRKLARIGVAGGGVRNVALNAAFRAARGGTSVTMEHLLGAARQEFAKTDKAIPEAELRDWT